MKYQKIYKYSILALAFFLPISITGSQSIVFLLTLTLLSDCISKKNFSKFKFPHKWVLLILFITPLFSFFNAQDVHIALKWYKRYFYILTIFIIASSYNLSDKRLKKLIGIYVLTASVASFIGVLQPFFGESFELPFNIKTYYVYSKGFISQSNAFAEIMTYSSIIAIYLLKKSEKGIQKIVVSIGIFTMYFSVIFTRARVSIILLSLILLISIPYVLKKKSIYFFSVLIVLLAVLSPLSDRIFWRFDQVLTKKSPRIELWKQSVEIFKENPIIGCGFGDLQSALKKREGKIENKKILDLTHAHNNILDVATTSGLVGLSGFLIFWLFIFKDLINEIKYTTGKKQLFVAILVALTAFHIVGFVNCNYKTSITSFQIYLFLGIFYGIKNQRNYKLQ